MQRSPTIFLALAFALSFGHGLFGQSTERPICGQGFLEQKPPALNQGWPQGKKRPASQQRAELVVPVVVHVVWRTWDENIGAELIASQLEALNRDFSAQNQDLGQVPDEFRGRAASMGISFCLASKTPSGQPTSGIARVQTNIEEIGVNDSLFFDSKGGSSAWDPEKYLNIWVANTGGFISGYGTYPGLSPLEKTGVVIHPKYFGQNGHPKYGMGRTLVHEVGHYFGLKHVWSDDPLCEEDGDGVEDTPKQARGHVGCPGYPQASCTASDMFMNFMDYVDDPCMLMFTEGQKAKIWEAIEAHRPGLLGNDVEHYCLRSNPKEAFRYTLSLNPAFGTATITFAEQVGGLVDVQIFDVLGRLKKHQVTLADQQLEIEIGDLDPGMYFVKVCGTAQALVKM